jgi:hypothetical protein
MDLTELTYDNMLPLTGSAFRIEFAGGRIVELILSRVERLREKHTSKKLFRDSFSMTFTGPADVMLQQGTYPMANESFGEPLPIFIVPVGKEEERYLYEAIFT